jgi:membrane fusion protein, multidrug efflux system
MKMPREPMISHTINSRLNSGWRRFVRRCDIGAPMLMLVLLAGCNDPSPPPQPLAKVKVTTAAMTDFSPTVTLTGSIMAQVQNDLSFRLSGKLTERNVDVGDRVTADQILAQLDPQQQDANLKSATAGAQSAEAQLKQVTANFERQKALLANGFTTRANYDQAEEALRTAQARLDTANAQLSSARDQLTYTVLKAGVPGVITARYAEAGQVVEQAKAIFTIAKDGARDAVFDVHESIFLQVSGDGGVDITLVSDPKVTAKGTAREVSPAVDSSTGTVKVKVGLAQTPPAMTLGAVVVGSAQLKRRKAIVLPWSTLFEREGKSAVWTVEPSDRTVSLKSIVVDQYATDRIVLLSGIEPGEIVVTAGSQSLRPGQKIAIAGEPGK